MRILFAIILLVPLTLFGQTKAVINGPEKANPGDLIILDASQSQGQAFAWTLIGNKTFLAVDNGRKCVFASGTPGVYVFVLSVAGETAENQIGVSVAKHSVKIGQPGPGPEPGPEPGPGPGPDPDPKPEPTPGPYWIIVLEETDSRTAETAKILQDKAFWKSQTDAGHKWRLYDDDAKEAQAFANLTTHRPALILTTFSGEVVKTMKLPVDTAGIKKVIREASGQ